MLVVAVGYVRRTVVANADLISENAARATHLSWYAPAKSILENILVLKLLWDVVYVGYWIVNETGNHSEWMIVTTWWPDGAIFL